MTLKEKLSELAKTFGKTTRWKVLCKEQNATSEEDKERLADQVLAEPAISSVFAFWRDMAILNGAKTTQSTIPYDPEGLAAYRKEQSK